MFASSYRVGMQIDKDKLRDTVKVSKSFSQVCRAMGFSANGGHWRNLKYWVRKLELDTSHFLGRSANRGRRSGVCKGDELFFTQGSSADGKTLRPRLIKLGMPYKCSICALLPEWNGRPLTLQVHHINQDHTDNRIENLTFVCPNCHTQAHGGDGVVPTFKALCRCCGKESLLRRHVVEWRCGSCSQRERVRTSRRPPFAKLEQLVREMPSVQVASIFNVSDTMVCKWCRHYGIKKPARGYWAKIKAAHEKCK